MHVSVSSDRTVNVAALRAISLKRGKCLAERYSSVR